MKLKPETYYAKILLFGEYSVIFNSMGLSIPYTHFQGELSFICEDKYTDLDFAHNSNDLLKEYLPYLKDLKQRNNLKCDFNIQKFEKDIKDSMYFESSIPQGYGLGSSGALVASLYDRYVKNKISRNRSLSNDEIIKLKEVFAQLESFFHGTSSGLDPLNAYIKFPILIKDKNTIEVVGLPRNKVSGEGGIFLINTGMPKKTEPLVNEFMRRNENYAYKTKVQNELIPLNNSAISNLVTGNLDPFFDDLATLSRFQIENMEFMIPDSYKDVWQKGYETGDYFLKLCGSGGGGYILGFTQDFSKTKQLLKGQNLDVVTVFKNPK